MTTDLEILIGLNSTELVGCVTLRRLLARFQSLSAIASAPERALAEVEGIGPATAATLRKALNDNAGARELEVAQRHRVHILPFTDPGTPPGFRALYDAPLVLYVRGTLLPEDAAAVAMVGTREATPYGVSVAERMAADLADAGVTVVSGLARGIDAAAHRGALRTGRTLAVLGSGVLRPWPDENEPLARRIAARGALLSEFPLRAGPTAVHFPRRNRLIAALGLSTVVVESGESSGALITSDWAVDLGKDVFAVPGRVDSRASAGCHRLIRQGAGLATCAEDVLEELGFGRASTPLSASEDRVYAALAAGPRQAAELAEETRLSVVDVEEALAKLGRRGRAKREGDAYVRA
jgi:DNA processing protein